MCKGLFIVVNFPANVVLYRKYSLDELLTNVMIYWTTGSIVSSMRFYKENFKSDPNKRIDALYAST